MRTNKGGSRPPTPQPCRTNTRAWKKLAAAYRAECEAAGARCWLCPRPIDYTLPRNDRWAFTVDHLIPLALGGDCMDRTLFRPAHRRCNSSRAHRIHLPTTTTTPPRNPSRAW